jgi:hypothetical protein
MGHRTWVLTVHVWHIHGVGSSMPSAVVLGDDGEEQMTPRPLITHTQLVAQFQGAPIHHQLRCQLCLCFAPHSITITGEDFSTHAGGVHSPYTMSDPPPPPHPPRAPTPSHLFATQSCCRRPSNCQGVQGAPGHLGGHTVCAAAARKLQHQICLRQPARVLPRFT